MRWIRTIAVSALLMAMQSVSPARTYVVSTSGNDGSAGTLAAPWRTLSRASSGLQPGDTVLVRGGVYHERFIPSNAGSPGNPIVYKSYPGEQAEIDGSPTGGLNVVDVPTSHVVIEGFLITNQNNFRILGNSTYWVTLDGDYITFRYNRVVSYGDVFDNIYVKNAISRGIAVGGHHVTLEHCYVRGQVFGIVLAGSAPRYVVLRYDTVHATGQNNLDVGGAPGGDTEYHATLIEYCQLDTSFIEDNIQFEVDYGDPTSVLHNRGTIVRYNRMGNAAENAIDLKGAGHTIIEHNLIYSSLGDDDGPIGGHDAGSGGGVTSNPNTPTRYTIIRGNVIWDHSTGMEMAEGDHYFSNTILNNRRTWQGPDQTGTAHTAIRAWNYPAYDRAFINNIVGAQPNVGVYDWLMDWGDKFDLNNNLYFDSGALTRFYHRMNGNRVTAVGLAEWKNVLATHSGYAYMKGKDAASVEADPRFTNVPAYPSGYDPAWDFTLAAGSPAIDAGGALTATTSGGTNATVLTVEDAYFFCDGFDVTGGDTIRIGGGAPVRIVSIDHARNSITLSEPRTWTAGAGVSLTYTGNAPDIGAFEFGSTGTPPVIPPVAVPTAVVLASPADGATGASLAPALAWTAITSAQSYQVQVSTSSSFATTVANASGLTGTSYTLASLTAGTVYYWRVRATNTGGTGPWSVTRSFTTQSTPTVSAPGTVQLASPANGTSGVALTPALTWTSLTTAQTYQVQIATASSFATTVVDVSGLTNNTYTPASLAASTSYYWRVRGANAGGNGPWSAARSFTTQGGTGDGDATGTQAVRNNDFESGTQDWTLAMGSGSGSLATANPGFSGSSAAQVTISSVSNNMQLYQQGITLAASSYYKLTFSAYSSSGHDLSVGVLQHVAPFTNYGMPGRKFPMSTGWRTRTVYFQTKNFTSTVSDARLQFAFQPYAASGDRYWLDGVTLQRVSSVPAPTSPKLVGPSTGATDMPTQVTLRWTEADGADTYQVQVATDAGFSKTVYDTLVADTLVSAASLLNSTTYYCRVRASNAGGAGAFSSPGTFTTAAKGDTPGKRPDLPLEIQLDQNYPNPFNPATMIRYRLIGATHVSLIVYNTLGAAVAVLADEVQEEGEHSVRFNGEGLPSGAYFYRLHADGIVETRKMILMR